MSNHNYQIKLVFFVFSHLRARTFIERSCFRVHCLYFFSCGAFHKCRMRTSSSRRRRRSLYVIKRVIYDIFRLKQTFTIFFYSSFWYPYLILQKHANYLCIIFYIISPALALRLNDAHSVRTAIQSLPSVRCLPKIDLYRR